MPLEHALQNINFCLNLIYFLFLYASAAHAHPTTYFSDLVGVREDMAAMRSLMSSTKCAVAVLSPCCSSMAVWNTSSPRRTSVVNSWKARFTLIFSNELGLMCASVSCGMAFAVTLLASSSKAAWICPNCT